MHSVSRVRGRDSRGYGETHAKLRALLKAIQHDSRKRLQPGEAGQDRCWRRDMSVNVRCNSGEVIVREDSSKVVEEVFSNQRVVSLIEESTPLNSELTKINTSTMQGGSKASHEDGETDYG